LNWIYQLVKALLDFLRETPAPKVEDGNAPKPLKNDLAARVADLPGLPADQGDPGAKR
jgi:hypothetical protein